MIVNGPLVDQEDQFTQAQSMRASKRDCAVVLDEFDTISLPEMMGAKLMNRTDTKYIFPESRLLEILKELNQDYAILDSGQCSDAGISNALF